MASAIVVIPLCARNSRREIPNATPLFIVVEIHHAANLLEIKQEQACESIFACPPSSNRPTMTMAG
jgi:hypothetical protein